jgi:AcrR family transcriptional regulator
MGHREDLLDGAVACLREKGYARTTARDIVAASNTNLGSIGYHYGSTEALLNAAVMKAIGDFGEQIAAASLAQTDPDASPLERFEGFWTQVIDSFEANRQIWAATFDVFSVGERVATVRTALAEGIQDGRMAWATLFGRDPDTEERLAYAVGSIHQALLSGVLVQWMIDPHAAPSAADLTLGLRTIAADITG